MPISFVSEEEIERTLKWFENPFKIEKEVSELQRTQPSLFAYLHSETFQVLTDSEREYLLFLTLAIFATLSEKGTIATVTEDAIGNAEEKNWEKLSSNSKKQFRHRLDVFFDETTQEDLLAFLEDALIEEDVEITDIGREPIFIAAKTCLDVLVASASDD